MHRKSEAELLPLDTEIERTLRSLRKITSAGSRRMANKIERLQDIPVKPKKIRIFEKG